jgi:HSP20 family protein
MEGKTMAAEQKDIQVSRKGESAKAPSRIMRPMEDIERMFDEFLSRSWLRPFRGERFPELRLPFETHVPRLDVVDRDNEVVVRAEVPGARREDIEISLTGNLLTIKGETKREEKEEKGDYYRCEISRGSFSRTVSLPAEVNEAGAKAHLREGVLELTLPKVEKAKKRAITID